MVAVATSSARHASRVIHTTPAGERGEVCVPMVTSIWVVAKRAASEESTAPVALLVARAPSRFARNWSMRDAHVWEGRPCSSMPSRAWS
jgi:hypothetical protein